MPRDTWEAILAINLSAAFHTMQALMPDMAARGFGRVNNIASVHGLVASKDKAPYVAAKFGLVGLSRVAALEYASAGTKASGGVTVNCIAPGWTETAIIQPQIEARAAQLGLGHGRRGALDLRLREALAHCSCCCAACLGRGAKTFYQGHFWLRSWSPHHDQISA